MNDIMFIGIDPGATGAIAFIFNDHVTIVDTPILEIMVGRKRNNKGVMVDKIKREFNINEMSNILNSMLNHKAHIGLEKVHAMPDQGVTSMFMLGEGYGIWKGIVSALSIDLFANTSLTLIPPQTWKKEMMEGMGKGKDAGRLRALQLFPQLTEELKLKKHHGRADALLIAEYMRRKYGNITSDS